MRSKARFRFALLAPLAGAILALVAVSAPAAQAASDFGLESPRCGRTAPQHSKCAAQNSIGPFAFAQGTTEAEARTEGYTQAAGHPAWGITDFKVNTEGTSPTRCPPVSRTTGTSSTFGPTSVPGVSTNPEAVPMCTIKEFGETRSRSGTRLLPAERAEPVRKHVIGVNKVTVYAGSKRRNVGTGVSDLPLEGTAYNVEQPQGVASVFGVALKLPMDSRQKLAEGFKEAAPNLEIWRYAFLEGQHRMGQADTRTREREWAGNYHDYYEIKVSTALPLIPRGWSSKATSAARKRWVHHAPQQLRGRGPSRPRTLYVESYDRR